MVLGKSGSVFNYFEKFTCGPFKKYSTSRFYKHSVKKFITIIFRLKSAFECKKWNTCRSNTCARCAIVRTLCASNQVANNLNNSMNHSAVFLHYLAYETVYVFVKTFSTYYFKKILGLRLLRPCLPSTRVVFCTVNKETSECKYFAILKDWSNFKFNLTLNIVKIW